MRSGNPFHLLTSNLVNNLGCAQQFIFLGSLVFHPLTTPTYSGLHLKAAQGQDPSLLDLALQFGGSGFYTYHIIFTSLASQCPHQYSQGKYLRTLHPELDFCVFAARSSLNCNLKTDLLFSTACPSQHQFVIQESHIQGHKTYLLPGFLFQTFLQFAPASNLLLIHKSSHRRCVFVH